MARRATAACCLFALACMSGCLTPWNTRFPQLLPRSLEYERRESEVQDPYPESDLGPDTASRPRDFGQQRPEPLRVRERSDAARLREQFGQPPGVDSPDTGAAYPEAVRQ